MGLARTLARLDGLGVLLAAGRSALFYAGWLAQAQLGMALSWGWFGGLGGVALWWAALAWLAHHRPALALSRALLCALAGVASGGLALAMAATGVFVFTLVQNFTVSLISQRATIRMQSAFWDRVLSMPADSPVFPPAFARCCHEYEWHFRQIGLITKCFYTQIYS